MWEYAKEQITREIGAVADLGASPPDSNISITAFISIVVYVQTPRTFGSPSLLLGMRKGARLCVLLQ